jgi:hypothetical protein
MQQSDNPATWSTTSFGGSADTSPMELDVLGAHLSTCRGRSGLLPALRHAAQRLHAHVAARIVTSMVVAIALLVGLGAWMLQGGPA